MIYPNDFTNLKEDIYEKVGQKIIIRGSLGRCKSFEKEATIEKAYPNLFTIRYEEDEGSDTYSYTDVLTGTVELEVFDGNEYIPISIPAPEIRAKRA